MYITLMSECLVFTGEFKKKQKKHLSRPICVDLGNFLPQSTWFAYRGQTQDFPHGSWTLYSLWDLGNSKHFLYYSRCSIVGCYATEDYLLEKEGVFLLIDLLEVSWHFPTSCHTESAVTLLSSSFITVAVFGQLSLTVLPRDNMIPSFPFIIHSCYLRTFCCVSHIPTGDLSLNNTIKI